MRSSPYRTLSEHPSNPEQPETIDDGELIPVFAIFWVSAVARLWLAVAHEESFGPEPTLAMLAVFLIPLMARDGVAALATRLRRRA